ncbi:MAG: glycosyltransferase [Acidimicrobiia bacterium]|jgi:MGT family glycosyltransferase
MSHVLIVSPDYASHYFPLSAVGASLQQLGHRVSVATGTALEQVVRGDGFEHMNLVLGPGSNPGIIRPETQSKEERMQLNAFFEATRHGMVATLLHQAANRQRDLLFEPERVAKDLEKVLDEVAPDIVLVDQLAFGATAALRGLGQPFVSFHPGHPSAISTAAPYGFPIHLPSRIAVDLEGLAELRRICEEVVDRFTREYNDVVAGLGNRAAPVANAFAEGSPVLTLVNYPSVLGRPHRLPRTSRMIGSAVRRDRVSSSPAKSSSTDVPRIYASLGSFFSSRSDLLRKIVSAFKAQPVELIIASGATDPAELGPIPDHWTVEPYLPQPTVIAVSDLVITHGGNNTVTESLTAGVPLLVAPLSTDQFAAAADVEFSDVGKVFDPNNDEAATISDLAFEVLSGGAVERSASLGRSLRARPGQEWAASLIATASHAPG